MKSNKHDSCSNCRFARTPADEEREIDDGISMEQLFCCRYAPRPTSAAEDGGADDAQWPRVEDWDWCGEFAPEVSSPVVGQYSGVSR